MRFKLRALILAHEDCHASHEITSCNFKTLALAESYYLASHKKGRAKKLHGLVQPERRVRVAFYALASEVYAQESRNSLSLGRVPESARI